MKKIRKWIRIIHRDAGYLFFGMFIIYGISGIALNHLDDWDPSYIIRTEKQPLQHKIYHDDFSKEDAIKLIDNINVSGNYKSHYFQNANTLKIFIQHGSITVNLIEQEIYTETIRIRPVFHEFNYLHYNNIKKLWTWFSDLFAFSMILIAITGILLLRGKKGLTGRGKWFMAIGILIPVLFLIIYL